MGLEPIQAGLQVLPVVGRTMQQGKLYGEDFGSAEADLEKRWVDVVDVQLNLLIRHGSPKQAHDLIVRQLHLKSDGTYKLLKPPSTINSVWLDSKEIEPARRR